MFWNKEKKYTSELAEYFSAVRECSALFTEAFKIYLEKKDLHLLERLTARVHEVESKCDDIRRSLGSHLSAGAFLPHFRADYFSLIEALDAVPDAMEHILYRIYLEEIRLPAEFTDDVHLMLERCMQTVEKCLQAAEALFTDLKKTGFFIDEVDRLESEIDRLLRVLIRLVYRGNFGLPEKIQYSSVIRDLAAVSDYAEKAAGKIQMIAVKRQV
ncbi:MAG: TIGR00153 family protein [Spirochaetes bacterium GWF1_41_5]|nr:MAG: TIGR00153 family protein [Spirochaetes bacterium GWF1_41_5]HBE04268.1 TIGR00153 family protein [Spirochaetia bacterium]